MALKNHLLDGQITKAAFVEFMKFGFRKASIRNIAYRAGVTAGAVYTRYTGKDALFCSLLENILDEFEKQGSVAIQRYNIAEQTACLEDFLTAMRCEVRIYIDIFFNYYDECVLLFCKSDGSSANNWLEAMIEHKLTTTVSFFKKIAGGPVNKDVIRLLLDANLHIYRKLLNFSLTKDEGIACIIEVQDFLEAGWIKLFKQLQNI